MRFRLRHKETGEFAIGTYDKIPACGSADIFWEEEDGALGWDYKGGSDVWWDGQEAETDPLTHEVYLVTESNDVCPESEFERVPVEEGDE